MRIRIIIPITEPAAVGPTLQVYSGAARPQTLLSAVGVEQGPASIECSYEDALATPQVIARIVQAEQDGVDAAIIDCMNDPGLEAARQAVSIPVVGVAQSSMLLAALLAQRFSVIGTDPRDAVPNERLAQRYGLGEKYASTRAVCIPVLELQKDPARVLEALVEASVTAIRQDGAHAIVLGCTGMKGMAGRLGRRLKEQGLEAPVIDPSLAALKWAELLVALKLAPSRLSYPRISPAALSRIERLPAMVGEETAGKLDGIPDVRVLVPVVRGFRKVNWLIETEKEYRSFARPDTRLQAVGIPSGPATLENLCDEAAAVPGILRLLRQAESEDATAAIIDCMADPGLDAAREAASIPVIGPEQASAITACLLGRRFSILSTTADLEPTFRQLVEGYGLGGRLASVRPSGLSVEEAESQPERVLPALIDAAREAVQTDGAHVVYPGCTGMIGAAATVQQALENEGIRVPVLEPPAIAVKLAEALSDVQLAHSKITWPKPPKKALRGFEDLEFKE